MAKLFQGRKERRRARLKRKATRQAARAERKQTRVEAKAAGTGKWSPEAIAGRQALTGDIIGAVGDVAGAVGGVATGGLGSILGGVGGALDGFGEDGEVVHLPAPAESAGPPPWMLAAGGVAVVGLLALVMGRK